MKLVLPLVLVGSVGCAKEKTAENCGALSVTIDGQLLAATPHGLARRLMDTRAFEVQMFNHDKSTCEEFIDRGGRFMVDKEVSVRAFAGGDGHMDKGVGLEATTQAGGDVTVVTWPKVVGDPVAICADSVSFTANEGAHKGKKIEIKGLFTGKFCGEMQM